MKMDIPYTIVYIGHNQLIDVQHTKTRPKDLIHTDMIKEKLFCTAGYRAEAQLCPLKLVEKVEKLFWRQLELDSLLQPMRKC